MVNLRVEYLPLLHSLKAPVLTPLATPFHAGELGTCGMGMYIPSESVLYFFQLDLTSRHVSVCTQNIFHTEPYHLDTVFDKLNHVWVLGLESNVIGNPDHEAQPSLTLYEIANEGLSSWRPLFQRHRARLDDTHEHLLAFWQHHHAFPLVCSVHEDQKRDETLSLERWRSQEEDNAQKKRTLGNAFLTLPFLFDETFLLFTCECPHETGHWCFNVTAYKENGIFVNRTQLPHLSLRSLYNFNHVVLDLWDWLWPEMTIIAGPAYGARGGATCIAACTFQVHPEHSTRWKEGHLVFPEGIPSALGGLYWIDRRGRMIAYEQSALGACINVCLCGNMVVGVDVLDAQWRLWCWLPTEGQAHRIRAKIDRNAVKVTVVAHAEDVSLFWCIEEYLQGIRISLWDCHHFQEVASFSLDAIQLVHHHPIPGATQEPCAIAYQSIVSLLGVRPDGQMQMIYCAYERM